MRCPPSPASRPRRPAPLRRASLCVLVGASMLVLGLHGALRPARVDAAGLEIVSVRHDPRGEIVAGLRVPSTSAVVSGVSALVDGAPRHAELLARSPEPAAIVIAIDTSASMAGEPLAGAQRAAMALVERLDPADEVAIVAFAEEPRVAVPFTTDRTRTAGALNALFAAGDTALYEAVTLSADLLSAAGDRSRALVLLSDGEDHGSALAGERARSLERLAVTGAPVQAFALGAEADTASSPTPPP